MVLADLEPWDCLLQLAAVLRRAGVGVELWSPPPRTVHQAVLRRLHRLLLPAPAVRLQWAGGRTAVDVSAVRTRGRETRPVVVEAADRVAAALAALPPEDRAGLPERVAASSSTGALYDKLVMTGRASRLGVPVPRTWRAPAQAGVHLPLMVKARLGSGGQDVLPAEDEAALSRAWAELSGATGGALVQELLPGEVVCAAGVADRGRVLAAGAFRSVSVPVNGPPNSIVLLDDRHVLEAAARLAEVSGYTGAFCLDFVRDEHGTARLVDVNARIFGSWVALQAAGVDLLGAYWRTYRLPGRPPGPAPGPARYGETMPDRPMAGDSLLRGAAVLAHHRPWLGWRWYGVAVVQCAARVVLHRVRRLRPPPRDGRG